jgi:hypothetical protein
VTKLKSWIIWGLILAGAKSFSAFQKCSDQLWCPLGIAGVSCVSVQCLVHRADTAHPAAKVKHERRCLLPLQVLVPLAATARPFLCIFSLVRNCVNQLAVGAFQSRHCRQSVVRVTGTSYYLAVPQKLGMFYRAVCLSLLKVFIHLHSSAVAYSFCMSCHTFPPHLSRV